MNGLMFSEHARARLQQRAIPPLVVDLLMQFGSPSRCGGAERLMFDKQAVKRLRQHLFVERWLNVYAIIGDNGNVVTIAHKCAHFHR
jgi:hypothetical protein